MMMYNLLEGTIWGGPRLIAESLWVYLTSFNNFGPPLVWLYIIATLITLLHFIFDLWR